MELARALTAALGADGGAADLLRLSFANGELSFRISVQTAKKEIRSALGLGPVGPLPPPASLAPFVADLPRVQSAAQTLKAGGDKMLTALRCLIDDLSGASP